MTHDLLVRYRRCIARMALGVLVVLAGACERSGPTDVEAAVPLRITAVVVGVPISTLVVEVSAQDIATPLVFNLTVVDGVAAGTIKIPPGPARTIRVTAVDAEGNVTHEGSTTVDVRPGQNAPLQIRLAPRAGHVPITVTFGDFGVLVRPPAATIDARVAPTLQLAVTVTNADGQEIAAPEVGWATTNPAVAKVTAGGLVTGLLDGPVTIVATFEGVAGLSAITVTGFGGTAACWAWQPTNVDPCAAGVPAPQGGLTLGEAGLYAYDTRSGELKAPDGTVVTPASVVMQQAGSPALRVVSVTALDVGPSATLRVSGDIPLVLLVHGAATVSGAIDVSAAGAGPGPGGDDPGVCSTGFGSNGLNAASSADGSGGGGGGGYGTRGGDGGGVLGNPGIPGGQVSGDGDIAPLRGGCAGGLGGLAGSGSFSAHGGGGGAVQISARQLLTVTGTVRSAGGGGGTNLRSGGGGGGSGGSILLESDAIEIGAGARLCANGGSGAEGGDAAGSSVALGSDGTCGLSPATTPNLNPDGGNGGAGGSASAFPGSGASGSLSSTAGGSGGGGGGSVGRVRVRGVTSRVISAAALQTPLATP